MAVETLGDADDEAVSIDMANPQPAYAELIPKHVVFTAPGFAMVTSRSAVDTVLRNHQIFTSEFDQGLGNTRPLIPLSVDPPRHAKYRKILDPLFAPKRMDAQEPHISASVNRFIDSFVDRGECNFSEEFAELFPSSVFLGLMGLPWEELPTFIRFRDGVLRPQLTDENALFDPEVRLRVTRAIGEEIYAYFGSILDERAEKPSDDILTHFLSAEIDGDRLTREEILDICFLFLLAGLDTVSDSLTCMFVNLASNPERRRQIVDRPELIPDAVEELLRWESPVPNVLRLTKVDFEIEGTTIPAGTIVEASLGAANLDPSEYASAMDVRFDREVNRHLAFGGGVHRCLGSHLARRELRVTLREWHRRIPEYQIKPGHEHIKFTPGMRFAKDLTLIWPT
jgi:cytochrome P450